VDDVVLWHSAGPMTRRTCVFKSGESVSSNELRSTMKIDIWQVRIVDCAPEAESATYDGPVTAV